MAGKNFHEESGESIPTVRILSPCWRMVVYNYTLASSINNCKSLGFTDSSQRLRIRSVARFLCVLDFILMKRLMASSSIQQLVQCTFNFRSHSTTWVRIWNFGRTRHKRWRVWRAKMNPLKIYFLLLVYQRVPLQQSILHPWKLGKDDFIFSFRALGFHNSFSRE